MRLRPKNWDSFQHYKDRRPAWIKLHHTLVDDVNFHSLKGDDAKYLVLIWLIASEDFGYLPQNPELAFRLRMSSKQLDQLLARLQAWIVYDASKPLAEPEQVATPEKEIEKNKIAEKRQSAPPDSVDARILCETVGIFDLRQQEDMNRCMKALATKTGMSGADCIGYMQARWDMYSAECGTHDWQYGSAHKFFTSGKWDMPEAWPRKEKPDGQNQSVTGQRVSNNVRAVGDALARRGVAMPGGSGSTDGPALPEPRPGAEPRGIPVGLREAGAQILALKSSGSDGRTQNQAGPELLPPPRRGGGGD